MSSYTRERRQLCLLLAPVLVGSLVLLVVPALATAVLALYEWTLLSPPGFLGLANFGELLADPVFHQSLRNSAVFAALAVPLRLLGALALALLLHRAFRGATATRAAAYVPTIVPDAAYALLWLFILNPVYGPLNALLGALGLPEPSWLTDPSVALLGIVLMSAFTIGEGFLVALATRRELPESAFEAARLETDSPVKVLRRVTLPLMAPTLLLLAARDIALTLQITFVPAYVLTDGGPDRATLFLPIYVYDIAFEGSRYGYGAAMTVTMFLITAVLIGLQYLVVRRRRVAW